MKFDFTPQGLLNMRHLRFKRLWLAIGLFLISGVTLASVVDVPGSVKQVMFHDKLIHAAVYACLMGWFSQIFRHDLTRLVIVLLLTAMGIGIEFLQGITPSRKFEFLDMVANTSGVLLAWALGYTWVGTLLSRFESLFLPASKEQAES